MLGTSWEVSISYEILFRTTYAFAAVNIPEVLSLFVSSRLLAAPIVEENRIHWHVFTVTTKQSSQFDNMW